MLFITEGELRYQYRQAPFKTFQLKPKSRLTPEAKQFLVDRQIVIKHGEIAQVEARTIGQQPEVTNGLVVACQKLASIFLLSFSLLLDSDLSLAEEVMGWQGQFAILQEAYKRGQVLPSLEDDSSELQVVERPEVTSFHIQLPQGRGLAILNCLVASLQEVDFQMVEQLAREEKTNQTLQQFQMEVRKINQAVLMSLTKLMRSNCK